MEKHNNRRQGVFQPSSEHWSRKDGKRSPRLCAIESATQKMKAKPKRRGEVQQEARYPAGDLAVDLVAAHAPHEAIRRGNLCYVMLKKKVVVVAYF